jgi:hypothetical protein
MSRMVLMAVTAAIIVAGCGAVAPKDQALPITQAGAKGAAAPSRNAGTIVINDAAGTAEVQKVEFRSGVSSSTVERIAKAAGCTGREGAGLVTEKGPVEIYRIQCENGKTFMARCELRQCKPMR